MNQTLREHRALRRGNAHLRIRKSSLRVTLPAHPVVSGALVRAASKSAVALERFADSWAFVAALGVVSIAILAARVGGVL